MRNDFDIEAENIKNDIEKYVNLNNLEEKKCFQEAFNDIYPNQFLLSKVVDQVVEMEIDERNISNLIKRKVKNHITNISIEQLFVPISMGSIAGILSSAMSDAPLAETVIAFNSIAAFFVASIHASLGAAEALKILLEYEKDVDILKETGLYDYVMNLVEEKKKKLSEEVEKYPIKDINEDKRGY